VNADRESLAQVVDLRIADLWRELFEIPQEALGRRPDRLVSAHGYGQATATRSRRPSAGQLCREVADALAADPRP
jgi:hypothetical protein